MCRRSEQGVRIQARGGLGRGGGEEETRMIGCGGVLGSQGSSYEGDRGAMRERRGWLRSKEKRKRNTTAGPELAEEVQEEAPQR